MENARGGSTAGDETTDENPNPSAPAPVESGSAADDPAAAAAPPSRTPFTSLSQLDADLALARTLQEQERAYMMLRMDGEYLSSEEGSYVHGDDEFEGDELEDEEDPNHPVLEEEVEEEVEEEGSVQGSDYDEEDEDDDFDVNEDGVIDPADFENDEAYARALQDAEEREVAVRLMALAGLNDWGVEDFRDHASHSQDTWQDVDPDELSYEELIALGEAVGTQSRGLSADSIASLPSVNYIAESTQDGDPDPCVICRLDYEDGDSLVVLSCKHSYHSECINKWLQINKVCPVCSAEVSTSGSTHA